MSFGQHLVRDAVLTLDDRIVVWSAIPVMARKSTVRSVLFLENLELPTARADMRLDQD
jgi:hypothetical protein